MSTQLSYNTDLPKPIECVTMKGEKFTANAVAFYAWANRDMYREDAVMTGFSEFGHYCRAERAGWMHDDLPTPPSWLLDASRCLQLDAEAGR